MAVARNDAFCLSDLHCVEFIPCTTTTTSLLRVLWGRSRSH